MLREECVSLLVQGAPPSFSKSTCNHSSTHTYALTRSYSLSSMVQSTPRCPVYSPTLAWEGLRARLFSHSCFSQIRFSSSLPSRKGSALAPGKVLPRALSGSYLERCCVHVGTQVCTRGYTRVYTRVHFSLLECGYILGRPTPSEWILLASARALRLLCPRCLATHSYVRSVARRRLRMSSEGISYLCTDILHGTMRV